MDKAELIMNILNYKTYEIRYDFRMKITNLQQARDKLSSASDGTKTDSEIALQLVDIEKEISELEGSFESQMQSIKEQKLVNIGWYLSETTYNINRFQEAQKQYEDASNYLDASLENVQKYYNVLLLLIQAEKEQLSDLQNEIAEVKHGIILEGLQRDMDHFTELQTGGWRTNAPLEKMSGSSSYINYFKDFCSVLIQKYNCIIGL